MFPSPLSPIKSIDSKNGEENEDCQADSSSQRISSKQIGPSPYNDKQKTNICIIEGKKDAIVPCFGEQETSYNFSQAILERFFDEILHSEFYFYEKKRDE